MTDLTPVHATYANSLSITIPATTAGNCLIVCAGSGSSTAAGSITSVKLGGAAGNFAQAAAQHYYDSANDSYIDAFIWADPDCAGGQTSLTITGTNLRVGINYGGVTVYEVPGLATSAVTDRTAGDGDTGLSWSSGATATTTVPSEFWAGAASTWEITTGPGSPWTSHDFDYTSTGWRAVTSTGAAEFAGAHDGGGWAACVATFKAAGGGAITPAAPDAVASAAARPASGVPVPPPPPPAPAMGTAPAPAPGIATRAGPAPAMGTTPDAGTVTTGQHDTPAPAVLALATAYNPTAFAGTGDLNAEPGPAQAWAEAQDADARPATVPAAPRADAAGAAPAAVPDQTGQARAAPATAAGQARAVAAWAILPPIYMSMVRMMAHPVPGPGGSQVAVAAPGSSQWTFLATIAHVQNLKYSFVLPGGADKATCTVKVPAAYRTRLFSAGWQVRIWRGGHICWTGRLDEPQPGPDGWTLTAAGDGQRARDFTAIWSGTWPTGQPDDAVNQAITRGLSWVNPGVGAPAWLWTGQPPDPGSVTLADFLTSLCVKGTGTWYVNSAPGGKIGADLSLAQIPTLPDRVLLVTTPVPRTLGAQVNRLVIRYQSSADNTTTGAAAAYALTTVASDTDIAAHQATEAYLDLSSAGTLTQAAAQAVGNGILGVYQRASWTGPFTAAPGQLMTLGGTPVDLGTEQAGTCVRCVLTDFGMGGEITPATPVQFPVAGYEYDDQHGIATLTPWQTVAQNLAGLMSLQQTLLRPATTS